MRFDKHDFGPGGVFVLGGSGAFGSAISTAFATAGTPVALSYFSRREAGEAVASSIRERGVDAALHHVDSSDRRSIDAAVAAAADAFGGLHSVVYAGGAPFVPEFFAKTDEDVWRTWLTHDLMGAINLAQAALPFLRESRGAFTSMSTYQGNMVEIRGGPSAISKGAIDRMVAVIAKEEGRYGVRANSVRCGWIRSERSDALLARRPQLRAEKDRTIPLRRFGSTEEIGAVTVFLSSRAAGFITGVNLTVDGGESL
jgi:NAD(P)-dependent dehydrogenase (short-subunit alcohol dehydrogenase family)